MRIVIVEEEYYLAQSIQNKLIDKLGARCEIYRSYREAYRREGDIFIINSTIGAPGLEELIERKRNSIILLLTSYVSHQTVTKPIELGADDYMQKPISVEELIRKIKHLIHYYKVQEQLEATRQFLQFALREVEVEIPAPVYPLFLKSSVRLLAEKVAVELAAREGVPIKLVDLRGVGPGSFRDPDYLYFCTNFGEVPNRGELFRLFRNRRVVVHLRGREEVEGVEVVELKSNSFSLDEEILPIEEYVKRVILYYQSKYPDTVLSRKLGISRKSLWEKRKKYGISRK
jgi:DNA-binding NtrC family response regulator